MLARCPVCEKMGRLSDEFAGRTVRCPGCGAGFVAVASQPVTWYYAVGDKKLGPIWKDRFDRLVNEGIILPETLVWCKGMDGWQPLAALHYPAETGGRDFTRPVGYTSATDLEYGRLWRRVVAKIVDLTFMLALAGMVEGLSRKLFPGDFTTRTISPVVIAAVLINIIIGIYYVTWFVGKFGATPGKMVVNLKITDSAGRKIGYGHAFGRYCGEYVATLGVMVGLAALSFWSVSRYIPFDQILASTSGAVFLTVAIVYLPSLFDHQRRTLYDRLCNTRVLAA